MTTIVMRKFPDRIEVAFDSKVSNGYTYRELKEPKVAEVNGMWIGVAGRLRALNAIHHTLAVKKPANSVAGEDLTRWVHRVLVPNVRKVLKDAIEGGQWDSESSILVAVNREVFKIDFDFTVSQRMDGIEAVGSGSDYARSAIDFGASVKEAVEYAGVKDIWSGYTIKSLTIQN